MTQPSRWQIRVDFDTVSPITSATARQLARMLQSLPGIDEARGSLTGHPSGISTTATVIIDGTSPGEALDAAIEAVTQACQTLGVSAARMREADIQHADVDPRE